MKKTLYAVMAAAMVASAGMTACSSQPAETTAAETTVAETTAEETTAEETEADETTVEETSAEEETEAEGTEELSEEELAALYHAFGEALQASIGNKDLKEMSAIVGYPCYIGIGDGIVVENEEAFLALNAEEIFTDELVAAVEAADLDAIEVTEAGFVVGDPSGKPNVTIGLDSNDTIGIIGINY